MLNSFYRDILPGQGSYCLFLLPERAHVWFDDIDDLTRRTEQAAERGGVYFGTSAFIEPTNRTQANVAALRALRLDIDAGPEKFAKHGDEVYETQELALAAVVPFFKATRLMPTYLVSSGAGLHIYFCLGEDLDPGAWKRLATSLAKLCDQYDLKIDGSVTTDSARVLRPLGGLHPSGERVRLLARRGPIYDVDAMRALLPAPDIAPTGLTKYASINDELDLGYGSQPSSALKAAQHCGALREVADSRGDVPEPHWRAMIGLVKRTVEGIDIAHEWSSGYDGYDPDEVERKFNLWSTGPTTCVEFAKHSHACRTCKFNGKVKSPISLGLMTQQEIDETEPEAVEQQVEEAPAADTGEPVDPWHGQIPSGFEVIRDKGGRPTLVYAMVVEKESETGDIVPTTVHVPFSRDIFWLGQWAEAFDTKDSAQVTLNVWSRGSVKRYLLDQTLIASQSDLLKFLAGKSVFTLPHKRAAQAMQDFVKASMEKIRATGHRPKIGDHLGLRILEDGQLVAVQGNHAIYPDGHIEEAMLTPALLSVARKYKTPLPPEDSGTWGPEVWPDIEQRAKQHVEFLRKHYSAQGMEKFQLAIMLCLSSPLMPFVDAGFFAGSTLPTGRSLSVSLFSRNGGRGKTTVMQAAMLAYGVPGNLVGDSSKESATDLARLAHLPMIGTLPSVMDEMGNNNDRTVSQAISVVANGMGRVRLSKDGALSETQPFALMNLIATNKSQRDMIATANDTTNAVQWRLLELEVDDMPEYDQAARDEFSVDWSTVNRDCAGALGAVLHRLICQAGVASINALVGKACSLAAQRLGAEQTGRFQYRGLGAMLAAHTLLAKAGLGIFPIDPLIAVFKEAYDAGAEFAKVNTQPTDGCQLLSRALQDLAPNTLVTENETHRGRNSGEDAYDRPLNERGIPDVIEARHIRSTGVTYLSVDALKAWCKKQGLPERTIVRDAVAAGVIQMGVRANGARYSADFYVLTKGMRSDMKLRCRCYTVHTRKLWGASSTEETPGETAT